MPTTTPEPDFNNHGWNPPPQEARANRRAWYVTITTFFVLVGLVVAAMVYRLSTRHDRRDAQHPPADAVMAFPADCNMPLGFERDNSPEAVAFRTTCSQCHMLPNPAMYDEANWRVVGRRMAAQMSARGLQIPDHQIELAIAYAIRHGRSAKPATASRPS